MKVLRFFCYLYFAAWLTVLLIALFAMPMDVVPMTFRGHHFFYTLPNADTETVKSLLGFGLLIGCLVSNTYGVSFAFEKFLKSRIPA